MWFLGTFILFLTLVLDPSLAGGRKIDRLRVSSKSGLILREKPTVKSKQLLVIPFESEVVDLEKDLYDSNDKSCELWAKVKWTNQKGYACLDYLLPAYEPFREFEFNIEKAVQIATKQFKKEESKRTFAEYENPIANSINFIDDCGKAHKIVVVVFLDKFYYENTAAFYYDLYNEDYYYLPSCITTLDFDYILNRKESIFRGIVSHSKDICIESDIFGLPLP